MRLLAAVTFLYFLIGAVIGLIVALLYSAILLSPSNHLGIKEKLRLSVGIPVCFFFLLFAWGWLLVEVFRPRARPTWRYQQP